jgi:hypothetical protein
MVRVNAVTVGLWEPIEPVVGAAPDHFVLR